MKVTNGNRVNGQMYDYKVGQVIYFTTRELPFEEQEASRNFQGNPFPIRTYYSDNTGKRYEQLYKVVGVMEGGSEVIPDRRAMAMSYLPEGHRCKLLMVSPLNKNGLVDMEDYTGVHWFLNVTHMAVSQNVDGMPLEYIESVYVL